MKLKKVTVFEASDGKTYASRDAVVRAEVSALLPQGRVTLDEADAATHRNEILEAVFTNRNALAGLLRVPKKLGPRKPKDPAVATAPAAKSKKK